MKNIVLIGMPACGKSTIGVLLAKRLGLNFMDTDIVIQQSEKRTLAQLLALGSPDDFRRMEQNHVLGIDVEDHVIATGGSVVYGHEAMLHLRRHGIIVYLFVPLALLEMRINDLATRGVVMRPSQTFRELFEERHVLYQRYADIEIDCLGRNHEAVATAIQAALDNPPPPGVRHD